MKATYLSLIITNNTITTNSFVIYIQNGPIEKFIYIKSVRKIVKCGKMKNLLVTKAVSGSRKKQLDAIQSFKTLEDNVSNFSGESKEIVLNCLSTLAADKKKGVKTSASAELRRWLLLIEGPAPLYSSKKGISKIIPTKIKTTSSKFHKTIVKFDKDKKIWKYKTKTLKGKKEYILQNLKGVYQDLFENVKNAWNGARTHISLVYQKTSEAVQNQFYAIEKRKNELLAPPSKAMFYLISKNMLMQKFGELYGAYLQLGAELLYRDIKAGREITPSAIARLGKEKKRVCTAIMCLLLNEKEISDENIGNVKKLCKMANIDMNIEEVRSTFKTAIKRIKETESLAYAASICEELGWKGELVDIGCEYIEYDEMDDVKRGVRYMKEGGFDLTVASDERDKIAKKAVSEKKLGNHELSVTRKDEYYTNALWLLKEIHGCKEYSNVLIDIANYYVSVDRSSDAVKFYNAAGKPEMIEFIRDNLSFRKKRVK